MIFARFVIVVSFVFGACSAFSADPPDWSQRGTWNVGDPRVRSSAAFNDRYPGATSRSSGWAATSEGVTLKATRGYGGVWATSRTLPLARSAVAAMLAGAARVAGPVALGVTAVGVLYDAGVWYDPDVGSWMYPAGVWYDGYPDGNAPSTCSYRAGSGCMLINQRAFIGIGEITSAWKSCNGGSAECQISVAHGNHPSGQFKRANCPLGTVISVVCDSSGCVSPNVFLPDGTCGPPPVGVPHGDPATDPQLQDIFDDHMAGNPSSAPDLAEEGSQHRPIPLPPVMPPWEGPESIPGDSSTTTETGPDGVTTVQKETTHVPQYGNPTPEDITVEDRTTETKTKPDGTTTTTTTTTTGTSTSGDGSTGSNSPIINPCVANPNASGCAPLGTLEDTELGRQDVDVSFSITSVSGSCPSPIALDILGSAQQLSWQPLCDLATGVAPIVRALAALSAGLWLLFMFRK